MATATVDYKKNGRSRKYEFPFRIPENPTKHNLGLAISRAMDKAQHVTKYTDVPKNYNLVMELLNKNSRITYPEGDKTNHWNEIIQDANERNQEEKPFKVVCEKCGGSGEVGGIYTTSKYLESTECTGCNGHGFLYKRLMWRVGYTFNHRHVIDIDGKDLNNAKNVKTYYERVLDDKYTLIETNGGYWLIGDRRYNDVKSFVNAHLKVFSPDLDLSHAEEYRKALMALDSAEGKEFKPAKAEDIKKSGLYHGFGDFDVTFTFLSIKRERSTLRVTSKRKGEKIEIVV